MFPEMAASSSDVCCVACTNIVKPGSSILRGLADHPRLNTYFFLFVRICQTTPGSQQAVVVTLTAYTLLS